MSVVVIGMDMPANCLQCSFVRIVNNHYYCGCNANCMLGEYVGEYLEGVGRHEGCPLVELPEGHGRLIDDSQLRETFGMGERCNECKQDKRDCQYNQLFTRMDFCGWLDEMETIVEAEGD